jgi:hypothetical protein
MEIAAPIALDDLQLTDWARLSFLHVGCGEGELCRAARDAGSKSVAGIQLKPPAGSVEARPRDPVAAVVKSLAGLNGRFFDAIVLSWSEQPARLAQPALLACLGRLSEQGALYIDMFGATEMDLAWSRREIDGVIWEAPTRLLLERELFKDTAFRITREVAGPTPTWRRYLVKAQHWRQDVILTSGRSQSGKTSLIRTLSAHGVATYSLDHFLQRVAAGTIADDSPFAPFVRERFVPARINELVDAVTEPGIAEGCADLLARVLPVEPRLLVTEGFLLSNDLVLDRVRAALRRQGRRCWSLSRFGAAANGCGE